MAVHAVVGELEGLLDGPRLAGHEHDAVGRADGELLACGCVDGLVYVWNVRRGQTVAVCKGQPGAVTHVAFSQGGDLLASASWDNSVILWDVDSHKLLATLDGHTDAVYDVAFSPDGKRLASASRDKTVILWDLDLDVLKAEACRTANRNLTCEEWRNYIGDDNSYHKTCKTLPEPFEPCD